jgi:fumarate hydratase subunit beta
MNIIPLHTPLVRETAVALHAGDEAALSGVIITARDAAHRRLCVCIEQGRELPLELRDQVIYFVGPTPAKPGKPIGSAGPTTSSRMDAYSPLLIEKAGIRGMIGKGGRNAQVIDAMKKYGCVYFAAVGGAGALLAQHIVKSTVVCYADLGTEAIHRLEVRDFPVIVAIDAHGSSLFTNDSCCE